MSVDLRRITKANKRHCRSCHTLVVYFTGPQSKLEYHTVDRTHGKPCAHDHRYYICADCCAAELQPRCVKCGSTDVRVCEPDMCGPCYVASSNED